MPRGGPRPGAGRPRQEQSRALDRAGAKAARDGLPAPTFDGDWLTLPRAGRGGRAPAWPLTPASTRERAVWTELWRMPQAVGWERERMFHPVALYVRNLVRAEAPDAPVGFVNAALRGQDTLGLTSVGLRMLRWKIAATSAETAAATPAPVASGSADPPDQPVSPKQRLTVVSDRPA